MLHPATVRALRDLRDQAEALDAADPLAALRDEFLHPRAERGGEAVYFCGNSLGLQPRGARAALLQELDDWAAHGVEGHFHAKHPWFSYHEDLTAPLARLLGAKPSEIAVMAGLTTTLHALLISFYQPVPGRAAIVLEAGAFPSDRYALASHARLHGYDPATTLIELAPRPGEHTLRRQDVLDVLQARGAEIALVMLGGVQYYTGQVHDMAAITAAARAQGCKVGWDLAHAAGNVALALHDWGPDFAAACSYKYLNAGPGSAAIAFVHERWEQAPELPRLAGWWGNDPASRFAMPETFVPARGAAGWQTSNAPVFSMAPLRASLALFDAATMPALRAKSVALTGLLQAAIDAFAPSLAADAGIDVLTPRAVDERGCQLSLALPGRAEALHAALLAAGVVGDHRRPDVIRLAPVPLYNRFADVVRFADVLASLLG